MKDVEGAANEYFAKNRVSIYGAVDVIDAFLAGAEWMKAKMMEGAVVSHVSIDELSCGLYNLCVEAGMTSETDTTIIVLPKEDKK